MDTFTDRWAEAATTTVGLFWMALWAFALGYLISSMIQVFVTRARMKKTMGETGARSVGLGTFFGFISSSCSFAALATTRALFAKGAGLVPSLAFLLASTNLVIELGIVIALFLSWQFVVGEYVGGLLLIGFTWLLVKLTRPGDLVEQARERAREAQGDDEGDEVEDWWALMRSREGWARVARTYVGEWRMVWKDVTVGFTVAGIIATFVPPAFFRTLFVGSGTDDPAFWQVLVQALVGPLAAFFTFIGSMGNIPLAAVLFDNGVAFAGVMAFIFSDLVVLPVLRIQAAYYGWKMALYIMGLFLVALVGAALAMHYGFTALDLMPEAGSGRSIGDRQFFQVDYALFLNIGALVLSAVFAGVYFKTREGGGGGDSSLTDRILLVLAGLAGAWLAIGLGLRAFG